MGLWTKATKRQFDKLGYPVPPSIDLSLNIEEAFTILEALRESDSEVVKELHGKIKEYNKLAKTRYQRPWYRADDF